MMRRLLKAYRFRRVRRDIALFPHELAAWAMRRCAEEGVEDLRLMLALAVRARDTAPPESRYVYERWVRTYAAGRRVKISTFSPTLLDLQPDDELVRAVDEAFAGWDDLT